MTHAAPSPTATIALQPQRIAATSLAIAIHLAAFGLLLMPLANQGAQTPASERIQVQWQQAQPPAPTPPPPVLPVQRTPTPPRTTPHSVPLPQSIPVLVDTVDPAAVAAAALALTPTSVLGSPAEPLGLDTPSGANNALQVLQSPPPAYPPQALQQRQQGEVLLRVSIDASGKVSTVEIERSSGHRLLDQAARRQVLRHWRFAPAQHDGRHVAAQGLVPINFRID